MLVRITNPSKYNGVLDFEWVLYCNRGDVKLVVSPTNLGDDEVIAHVNADNDDVLNLIIKTNNDIHKIDMLYANSKLKFNETKETRELFHPSNVPDSFLKYFAPSILYSLMSLYMNEASEDQLYIAGESIIEYSKYCDTPHCTMAMDETIRCFLVNLSSLYPEIFTNLYFVNNFDVIINNMIFWNTAMNPLPFIDVIEDVFDRTFLKGNTKPHSCTAIYGILNNEQWLLDIRDKKPSLLKKLHALEINACHQISFDTIANTVGNYDIYGGFLRAYITAKRDIDDEISKEYFQSLKRKVEPLLQVSGLDVFDYLFIYTYNFIDKKLGD